MKKLVTGERGIAPLVLLVAAVVLFIAVLGFVVREQGLTAAQLCRVIEVQVKNQRDLIGKPGTAGFAYYAKHPDELEAARRQVGSTLSALPCR